MELRISDGERARYTEIYGVDPLASGGWLTRRMKHGLTVLGCDLPEAFDLLNASDGQVIEAPAMRGPSRVIVQIEMKRENNACSFSALVRRR